ncbi:MAG: S8 family serine peptidase [Bacteroidota bacterium]
MKQFLSRCFCGFALCSLLIPALMTAKNEPSSAQPEIFPGIIYVKLKSQGNISVQSLPAVNTIRQKYAVREMIQPFLKTAKKASEEEFTRIFKMIVPVSLDITNALRELRADPAVEYAEPSYIRHTTGYIPNDPSYASMYSLAKINASAAWDITKGDSTVVIGIVDSGVDYLHEDLAANIWTNPGETGLDGLSNDKRTNGIDDDNNGFVDDWHGWDFVGGPIPTNTLAPDNDPHPKNGNPHGTHTAGTASAVTDNVKGVASIGFNCSIMITKHGVDVSGSTGIYVGSDGILYCINNGADIVSCSWGGPNYSQYDQDIVRYGLLKNVVIVAAAGNGGADVIGDDNEITPFYPAGYRGVLSVGASDSQDKKAGFSNYGRAEFVKVVAPGVDILSTVPGSAYQSAGWSGTSMATPLVSGLAGLIRSLHPDWTAGQIMFQICGTSDDVNALNPSFSGKMGYGRINAFRALSETPAAQAPEIALTSFTVDDATGGNGNGILEPGENAKINVIIRNNWGDAHNLNAVLSTSHWTTTVTKSSSAYGMLRGIAVVDSSQRGNLNDEFEIAVSADAIPQVVPFTVAFTADGGYTKQFKFSIAIGSSILLVDDDDGSVNVESFYTDALSALGTAYDVWDHSKQGTPSAALLSKYSMVVWFCEWTFPSLDSGDVSSIMTYLNGGGKLFISGQDLAWDMADPGGTAFNASGGASKTFLENYLKAKYIADDAATSAIVGVPNDSIGDGLSYSRYQVNRAANEQFPDVIQPVGGSVPSFTYNGGASSGMAGAVRYNGAYKVVYFSFGGIEAITDTINRVRVLERVINWLEGSHTVVDKLKDTENTTDPYGVSAVVTTASTIQTTQLFYDIDGQLPFNKTPMTFSAGKYSANIPAYPANSLVEYFVLVKTDNGFLPFNKNAFFVGPDVVKPVIDHVDTIDNVLKGLASYPIVLSVKDNIQVDSNSVILKYNVNNGTETELPLSHSADNQYAGALAPASALSAGDVVQYYIVASDNSIAKNSTRYPPTGSKSFIVGREVVDNFESVDSAKWNLGGWGYSNNAKRGLYSITDSPEGKYLPNTERSLVLKTGYDLTTFTKATLQYYRRSLLNSSDTAFIEISRNGSDWQVLKKITNNVFSFVQEQMIINGYTGPGNDNVKFRIRMKSDATNESDGIYIDDIEVFVDALATSVTPSSETVPTEFTLTQNYPNPFNPSTTIQFSVPTTSFATVTVYDGIGREIVTLAKGEYKPGIYNLNFDASKFSSGIYFYRLQAGTFIDSRKMLLLK